MLAEGIAINQEVIRFLLEDYGMNLECAENGQIAVERFLAEPQRFEIIFMDLHMPVMDGYSATKAIRGSGVSNAKTIPILAMTANAFTEDVASCHDAGMNDHIAKPVDLNTLLQKMV